MSQQPFPGAYVPGVNLRTGYFTTPWIIWLQQLAGQPAAPASVVPTASPFSYMASGTGFLAITGGTVSAVTLTRGGVTAAVGSTVPVANGDVVTITFSGPPTISFIPG